MIFTQVGRTRSALLLIFTLLGSLFGGIYLNRDWSYAVFQLIDWRIFYLLTTAYFIGLFCYLVFTVKQHFKAVKAKDAVQIKVTEAIVAIQMILVIIALLMLFQIIPDLLNPSNPVSYSGKCDVSLRLPSSTSSRSINFNPTNCSLNLYGDKGSIYVGIDCTAANKLVGYPPEYATEYKNISCKRDVTLTYLQSTQTVIRVQD